jgi:hypothetical protein
MRFAIKGVFQIETHFLPATRPTERLYESRVINLNAETEMLAYYRALAIFKEDEWEAIRPASHIEYQEQRFLGISQIRDLEFMEPYEVWYEYFDECPTISYKLV